MSLFISSQISILNVFLNEYKIRNALIKIRLIEKWFHYLFFFLKLDFREKYFFYFLISIFSYTNFRSALIISLSKNQLYQSVENYHWDLIELSWNILYNYLYIPLSQHRATLPTLFTNWHRNLPDFSVITRIYGFPISR